MFLYSMYWIFIKEQNITNIEIKNTENLENLSNKIEGIEYLSTDINSNAYHIKAEYGVIDEKNNSLLKLFKVRAELKFNTDDKIYVYSEKAVYNTMNYNTEFIDNANLVYDNHEIRCDVINAKFTDNIVILTGNLFYKNLETELYADEMRIDLINRSSITKMFDKNQKVKIYKIIDGNN